MTHTEELVLTLWKKGMMPREIAVEAKVWQDEVEDIIECEKLYEEVICER